MKFDTPEQMLQTLKDGTDLYNPVTMHYVFGYNEAGSIAVYFVTADEAEELKRKSEDTGEYWGALLGAGGSIYDDESYEGRIPLALTNLDYCESCYADENWMDVTPGR